MGQEIACPSCSSTNLIPLGKIPPSDCFAGRQLSTLIPGGKLFRCSDCNLTFRHPRLSQSELNQYYRDANTNHWQYRNVVRQDWNIAKNWLSEIPHGKILDLGCWDGNFLAGLPAKWQKFGVEIHTSAAERAGKSGVRIIGEDVFRVDENLKDNFDVVTAFDVFEHAENPMRFLRQLLEYARPGGYVFIGTGNTDAWTWRLAKSRYWYCWPAEHLSFISKAWFEYQESEMPFSIRRVEEFAHHSNPTVAGWISQSMANLLYLFAPAVFYALRRWRWKRNGMVERKVQEFPPVWNCSRDHLLVVLQKHSKAVTVK